MNPHDSGQHLIGVLCGGRIENIEIGVGTARIIMLVEPFGDAGGACFCNERVIPTPPRSIT